VDALEDKKAEDIILMDVREVASFTDYMIVCTGSSNRMLRALAEGTNTATREQHKVKGRVEGDPDGGWMVLDFGDIVVHIFDAELRNYYKLEELWKDGKILLRVQ